MDRVNFNNKRKLVYPLVDAGWTKEDVKTECASWPFDLDLKGEHYGNCVWCWKKSLRKLMTLAQEDESVFDFPKRMEDKYGHILSENHKMAGSQNGRFIFRNHLKTEDIIELSKTMDFEPYEDIDQMQMFSEASYDVFLDTGSACGESCEIGADDQ